MDFGVSKLVISEASKKSEYTSFNIGNQIGNQSSKQKPNNPIRLVLAEDQAAQVDRKAKYRGFPGSAFLEKTFCGSIDTTDPAEYEGTNIANRLFKKADIMCVNSSNYDDNTVFEDSTAGSSNSGRYRRPQINPSSALLARALVLEVTDNPKTMKPAEMTQREYRLIKAQNAATKRDRGTDSRPVGAPGGIGSPNVLDSFAFACTGNESTAERFCNQKIPASIPMSPGHFQENRLSGEADVEENAVCSSPYAVTIGLCLSRRHSVGHPDTVSRQNTYDFNELQDRQYQNVCSTDDLGWRAGGGEKGIPARISSGLNSSTSEEDVRDSASQDSPISHVKSSIKKPHVDMAHIPIIQIDCPTPESSDRVIHALASGDIFIPHMSVRPESISVQGVSPFDLIVRFDCQRSDDTSPDEWPNWSLEFMHNQLFEYFSNSGARWMNRPFGITLAKKVQYRTVKHMNRYYAQAERVIDNWRGKGSQYLVPLQSHMEGGATPDEVARPHGIYLLRNGIPTNYFAPNFDTPYTTKMTRSLLQNVIDKSWNRKRREWNSHPLPKILTPGMLFSVACGCTDANTSGFMASQVTKTSVPTTTTTIDSGKNITNGKGPSRKTDDLTTPPPIVSSKTNVDELIGNEEKKTDDVDNSNVYVQISTIDTPFIRRVGHLSTHPNNKIIRQSEDFERSVELSAVAQSIAASQTTVMHTNTNNPSLPFHFRHGRTADDVHSSPKEESLDPPGEKISMFGNKASYAKPFDRSPIERGKLFHQEERTVAKRAAQVVNNKPVERSPLASKSSLSMDYSVDGSSAFITLDGSSLIGAQFTGDGSTIVQLTKNNTSASAFASAQRGNSLSPKTLHGHPEEDETKVVSHNLSIQESTSSLQSIIPSDEELFAFGWAKAMDPKSGNYYYFTLDRTKTVWDNPLSQ